MTLAQEPLQAYFADKLQHKRDSLKRESQNGGLIVSNEYTVSRNQERLSRLSRDAVKTPDMHRKESQKIAGIRTSTGQGKVEILLSRMTPTPQKPAASHKKKKVFNQDLISIDVLAEHHHNELLSEDDAKDATTGQAQKGQPVSNAKVLLNLADHPKLIWKDIVMSQSVNLTNRSNRADQYESRKPLEVSKIDIRESIELQLKDQQDLSKNSKEFINRHQDPKLKLQAAKIKQKL